MRPLSTENKVHAVLHLGRGSFCWDESGTMHWSEDGYNEPVTDVLSYVGDPEDFARQWYGRHYLDGRRRLGADAANQKLTEVCQQLADEQDRSKQLSELVGEGIRYKGIVDRLASYFGCSHDHVEDRAKELNPSTELESHTMIAALRTDVETQRELHRKANKRINELMDEVHRLKTQSVSLDDLKVKKDIERMEVLLAGKGDVYVDYVDSLWMIRRIRETMFHILKAIEYHGKTHDGNGDAIYRDITISERQVEKWWEVCDPLVRETSAAERIAAERERQRRKWSPKHDDGQTNLQIARAATHLLFEYGTGRNPSSGTMWGVAEKYKGNWRKQLIVAGALICAEFERRERAEQS